MTADPFERLLLSLRLVTGAIASERDSLAPALLASTLDLHAHQVEAALFALDPRRRRRGALFADEVGLGKTIEAGLVIAERLAQGARRILILVPASLRGQWRAELRRFFGIEARVVDLALLRRERQHFSSKGVFVTSLNFFSNDTNPPEFREADWDLVVIDEAHRLRNVWRPGARRARALRELLRGKPKLLLSATPLQNSLLELFGLVSFLDEKLLGTEAAFRVRFLEDERGLEARNSDELKARLAQVCVRTLRRQVLDTIRFTARRSLTYDFEPSAAERELYEGVSSYLADSRTIAAAFGNRELLLLLYRKILASSTFAVAATLRKLVVTLTERLAGRLGAPELDDDGDDLEEEREELAVEAAPAEELGCEDIEAAIAELRAYAALADSISTNAKGERMVAALHEVFGSARLNGWPEKAVIFTESRRTQEYLGRLLAAAGYRGKVTLLHGASGDADDRDALVEEFRHRSQILIATEAGAEGLNLQFCNVVVNYDLPWNPQRIEQRIGRCHRYGQSRDVLVVNFLNTTNAADRRLLELLSSKLSLFDGVFGSSDEVLGALESGVDFERRVLEIYEQCRTPEEIDRAFERLQGEIERTVGQLGAERVRLLDAFDEEVRARLAHRRVEMGEKIEGVSASVRDLVLGSAESATEEVPGVFRLAFAEPIVRKLAAADLPERASFTPGGDHVVLGPWHPLVRAIAAHTLATEGGTRVHELVVRAQEGALAAHRGKRGYWIVARLSTGSPDDADRLIELALCEGGEELGPEFVAALARAPREHAGYSVLAPAEAVLRSADAIAAAALAGHVAAGRARTAGVLAEERIRLERYAAEALAASRRHIERAEESTAGARQRLRDLAADTRATVDAIRGAKGVVDLLDGQLRHERELLASDQVRHERDTIRTLAELEARLALDPRAVRVAIGRFWLL